MKLWSIYMLSVLLFFSVVSYGDISFDTSPCEHPNSLDLVVDYDNSATEGNIFVMSQDGKTIYSTWPRFTSLAGISYDQETDNIFIMEYNSPGNYRAIETSSLADYFNLKESFKDYGWNRSLVYDSDRERFYVNEYKGDTLNRISINGFDDFSFEKSYDLNSLISEMYIVILIGLLVFSAVRMKMRFRSV